MTYQELFELVPSDTLQRDLEKMIDGVTPAGYSITELETMWSYLNETPTNSFICPECKANFAVDVDTLQMSGLLNCPYCGKEIKED